MRKQHILATVLAAVVLFVIGILGDWTPLIVLAPAIAVLSFSKHDYVELQYGDPRNRR